MRAWIRFGENVVLLALCACLPLPALSQSVEPNVVFILVDDLRWDALGSSGHPFIETPNIDRIANEGINFTNAFVTTPICSPGRASFYTGQYTRTHDIKGNGGYNSVSDRTLRNWARALQEVGYRTAHIGKWHMDPTSAPRNGFDYWVGFKGQGSHNGVFLNVNGIPVNETGYTTDVLTDYAIDFVQQDHGGRPFAMTLAFKAVHAPWPSDNSNVPPDLRTLYENETIPRAPSAQSGYTLEGKPMLVNPPEGMNPPVPGSTGVADAIVRNQLRMTVHIDQNIGRLFSALDTAGKLDDTLFIFTSDNGYFWSEHGLGDKRAAYDEAIRIPLLMRLPGLIMPGISSNALVANIDIAPTLMSLGGADVPSHVQGESLLPLMYDPSAEVRGSFLAEYFQESAYPRIATWKAIRTQQFKYITHPDFGASYDELYDLTTDPYEMNNIVNESYAQTTLADMKNQLGQLEQQIQFDTKQLVVSGDTLDYAITEDSTVAGTGSTIRIGSNANAPAGGRNAVFVFELPVLEPGDSIDSASLTYRVRPLNSNNPATHADIWMLGIGDSTRRMNYLESESDGNRDHQLIDDNMLWWDRSQSFVATTPDAAAALAASLNAFYREHPDYPGGSYLYLRLNPDADTGNGDAGWDVFSADETESRFRPSLTPTRRSRNQTGLSIYRYR